MSWEPGPPEERWSINLPAVVGVVFIFLAGVVIWVVTSSGSDDDSDAAGGTTTIALAPTTDAPAATTATTTPPPMPDVTGAPASTTQPPPPSSAPEVTSAPGSDPDAVPGDLGIAGAPMQAPPCNDSFITIIASAVGDDATAGGVSAVLDQYPASNYLRTDQTCPSLTQDVDGEAIYVVYFGPFPFASDACAARANGTPDAYARQLSETLGPGHSVDCPDA